MSSIITAIEEFDPIFLREMADVNLMNRIDTKFAFRQEDLMRFLPILAIDYRALKVEGTMLPHYESLYFDDATFSFFRDHHNGKADRFKVRIRKYVESNIFFLEIKHKFKGRTDKRRILTNDFNELQDEKERDFLRRQLNVDAQLKPTMWNAFQRITLVSRTSRERLTLDFNIHFHMGEIQRNFDQLVIAELKQENLDRNSPFYKLMKKERIRPYRLSKYCIGSVEIYGEEVLKFNRFKKKLLFLNKINHAH
ncbi:MAG: polyphosphate polymerase domain-containing protein [Cryomorphaceae bacterium]|jgi:hypothetical protein|nr:polyphosphate polymerase domain-containing protein [Cryomorphaceae bacterium]